MHFLDYMIVALIGYNSFVGLRQGAIRMINGILGLVIATSLSKTLFETTFDPFASTISFLQPYPFLYFGFCFLILIVLCQIIAQFLHTVFNWSGMGLLNHISGLVLGALRGLFIVLIFIIPLMFIKPDFALQSKLVLHASPLTYYIIDFLNKSGFVTDLFKSISIPAIPLGTP